MGEAFKCFITKYQVLQSASGGIRIDKECARVYKTPEEILGARETILEKRRVRWPWDTRPITDRQILRDLYVDWLNEFKTYHLAWEQKQ